MNIKLIRLNRDNRKLFYGLDPFSYLEQAPTVPQIELGAVLEGERGDTPCGVAIFCSYPEALVIRWLYVSPEYRGQGAGETLLSAAFDSAARAGKSSVAAMLSKEYGRGFLCPYEREFWKYQGFEKEIEVSHGEATLLMADVSAEEGMGFGVKGIDVLDDLFSMLEEAEEAEKQAGRRPGEASVLDDWDLSVLLQKDSTMPERTVTDQDTVMSAEEIASCRMLQLTAKDRKLEEPRFVPLAELTLTEIGDAIEHCLEKHPYEIPEGGEALDDLPVAWFDPKLSFCAKDWKGVHGIFLVHKNEDGAFQAEYLCDTSQSVRANNLLMLRHSAEAFVKNYPADTKAVIPKGTIDWRNGF